MEELQPASAEQVASEHQQEIMDAVAARFKLSHDTLDTMHVVREHSHHAGPGTYAFTVAHKHKGALYRVLGRAEDGVLHDLHVMAA